MMLAPAQVVRLFNPEDVALQVLTVHAMRICVLMMPLVGFQVVSTGYFIAVGKPRESMLVSLSRQILFSDSSRFNLAQFFRLKRRLGVDSHGRPEFLPADRRAPFPGIATLGK